MSLYIGHDAHPHPDWEEQMSDTTEVPAALTKGSSASSAPPVSSTAQRRGKAGATGQSERSIEIDFTGSKGMSTAVISAVVIAAIWAFAALVCIMAAAGLKDEALTVSVITSVFKWAAIATGFIMLPAILKRAL